MGWYYKVCIKLWVVALLPRIRRASDTFREYSWSEPNAVIAPFRPRQLAPWLNHPPMGLGGGSEAASRATMVRWSSRLEAPHAGFANVEAL